MSQTRKKRRERAAASQHAEVAANLNMPEVVEAVAGEALAAEREAAHAAALAAEQDALIEATQHEDGAADTGFHLKRTVESMLFAADRPITVSNLRQYLGQHIDRKDIQVTLDELVEEYSSRGIVLHDVAGGYQFRTHPASSNYIQKLIAGRPVRLTRAQLDTLAIVAYRQPITRPEIDDIRGVDSGGTLKVLLDRNLLRVLGKKEEVGRPLLYGTTKDFLEFFNLSELRDLPTLREFHELNDEGMAQVDKLGADIEGVDVAAVAAEVAAEREAEEAEQAAAAEAAKAQRLAEREAARREAAGEPPVEAASEEPADDAAQEEPEEEPAVDAASAELKDEPAVEAASAKPEEEPALEVAEEEPAGEALSDDSWDEPIVEEAAGEAASVDPDDAPLVEVLSDDSWDEPIVEEPAVAAVADEAAVEAAPESIDASSLPAQAAAADARSVSSWDDGETTEVDSHDMEEADEDDLHEDTFLAADPADPVAGAPADEVLTSSPQELDQESETGTF